MEGDFFGLLISHRCVLGTTEINPNRVSSFFQYCLPILCPINSQFDLIIVINRRSEAGE